MWRKNYFELPPTQPGDQNSKLSSAVESGIIQNVADILKNSEHLTFQDIINSAKIAINNNMYDIACMLYAAKVGTFESLNEAYLMTEDDFEKKILKLMLKARFHDEYSNLFKCQKRKHENEGLDELDNNPLKKIVTEENYALNNNYDTLSSKGKRKRSLEGLDELDNNPHKKKSTEDLVELGKDLTSRFGVIGLYEYLRIKGQSDGTVAQNNNRMLSSAESKAKHEAKFKEICTMIFDYHRSKDEANRYDQNNNIMTDNECYNTVYYSVNKDYK